MRLWIDAQLSPHLAPWLAERFGVEVWSVRRLGYLDAADETIIAATRDAEVVVMTKDRVVLISLLPDSLALLDRGETLVEIGDRA